MPEMRGLSGGASLGGNRRASARSACATGHGVRSAALLAKEFQLHQSQFIMAGVLLLLHLGVIATRKFGHFPKNSSPEFVLE